MTPMRTPLTTIALGVVLALAPLLGGSPPGTEYGADVGLGALRCLALLAATAALAIAPAGGRGLGRAAMLALWVWSGLAVVSLLAHSKGLTDPFLLFAQVPAALDTLTAALVFLACHRVASSDKKAIGTLAGALVLGMTLVALLAAREYGDAFRDGEPWHRSSGLMMLGGAPVGYFSPNFAAGFLGLTLPICAALLATAKERIAALLYGAGFALGLGALASTGSRFGAAAAALGLLVALAASAVAARGRLPWGRLAAALAVGLICVAGFRQPLLGRKAAGASTTAATGTVSGGALHDAFREATWAGTAAMAKANPWLGTGPGTFPYLYSRYAIVGHTGLAHSSYLQTAAETGAPSLIALLTGIALAVGAGIRQWSQRAKMANGAAVAANSDNVLRGVLLAGLLGGATAALARQFFDSEWSLLGSLIVFAAVLGLLSANGEATSALSAQSRLLRFGPALGGGVALLFALVTFAGSQGGGWPPDPVSRAASGDIAGAARLDPTPLWQFQLARMAQRDGRHADAVAAFVHAVESDPNSFQSQRALAEAKEMAGDSAGALVVWRELIRRAEGPAGTIRALPESTDTNVAYAYTAVAASESDPARAAELYKKATAIVDAYSRTAPEYQLVDFGATATRERVVARRQELIALYEKAVENGARAMQASGDNAGADTLRAERAKVVDRILKMATPS